MFGFGDWKEGYSGRLICKGSWSLFHTIQWWIFVLFNEILAYVEWPRMSSYSFESWIEVVLGAFGNEELYLKYNNYLWFFPPIHCFEILQVDLVFLMTKEEKLWYHQRPLLRSFNIFNKTKLQILHRGICIKLEYLIYRSASALNRVMWHFNVKTLL